MDRSSGPDSRERPGALFAPRRPALTSGPPVRLIRTDTRHSRPTSGPSRAVCQKSIVMQCFFARRPGRPGSAYQSPARAARADPSATNRNFCIILCCTAMLNDIWQCLLVRVLTQVWHSYCTQPFDPTTLSPNKMATSCSYVLLAVADTALWSSAEYAFVAVLSAAAYIFLN